MRCETFFNQSVSCPNTSDCRLLHLNVLLSNETSLTSELFPPFGLLGIQQSSKIHKQHRFSKWAASTSRRAAALIQDGSKLQVCVNHIVAVAEHLRIFTIAPLGFSFQCGTLWRATLNHTRNTKTFWSTASTCAACGTKIPFLMHCESEFLIVYFKYKHSTVLKQTWFHPIIFGKERRKQPLRLCAPWMDVYLTNCSGGKVWFVTI